MTTLTRILDSLQAADQGVAEIDAAIGASKDPGEIARQISLAEAHIGAALEAISDARKLIVSARVSVLVDLTWAEIDLHRTLRALGRAKAALATPQETRE
jgi:enamine deaminase RidA (YjgF/YER057c/UK114 family)